VLRDTLLLLVLAIAFMATLRHAAAVQATVAAKFESAGCLLEPTGRRACCQEAVRTRSHEPAGDVVPAKSTGQVEKVRTDAALAFVGCIGPDIAAPVRC
jgi:hypothetical protein